ncbi:threonine/serine exporter family protein [Phototrophicus methaneseepsis]|uniref:Threonine/serine exporter family protein n=1 Tax=Phototrophicus methaneseepsis TaxID=2710758 RepID=A0A7S8ICX8_9CHLR|nr:threonine/serine exporter family protein [Phototrophicus methaneseepsis]QPC81990.1 threonine/serine exporter family protein [Phototrophicus methaneseepsis]
MIDLWPIVVDAFWSGIAATGFAILFNVPRRALIYCALLGALGHATRTFMMHQFGLGIALATLIGALSIGFLAKLLAHRLKIPSMIFGVSAAIPMVPGVFAYQTMIGLLELVSLEPEQGQYILTEVAVNAVRTGAILAALGLGITTPAFLLERKKPVV